MVCIRLCIRCSGIQVTLNEGGQVVTKSSIQPVVFNVFPPVRMRLERDPGTRCLGPDRVSKGWDDGCVTELLDMDSAYTTQLITTGGQQPYRFPAAGSDLPPGVRIEQIFQISGTPVYETINATAGGSLKDDPETYSEPVETDYAWQVIDSYPGSVAVETAVNYMVGVPDCQQLLNGPNGEPCNSSDGTSFDEMCEDLTVYDRLYGCDCGGLRQFPARYVGFTNETRGTYEDRYNTGINCEIVPPPPPVVAAAAAEPPDNAAIISVAVLFVIFFLVAIAYVMYQRHLLNIPFDFEAEQKRMMAEGTLSLAIAAAGPAVEGEDGEPRGPKMPDELKRNRVRHFCGPILIISTALSWICVTYIGV